MSTRAPEVSRAVAEQTGGALTGRSAQTDGIGRNEDRPPSGPIAYTDVIALSGSKQTNTIIDHDATRTHLTRLLIAQLGSAMGFDPRTVEVHVDTNAEVRINARGAQALQEGNRIFLHPSRYDPRSPAGRFLLAHEVVHFRQRDGCTVGTLGAAEREADRLGLAFATHRPLSRPTVSRPAYTLMAFEGPSFDGGAFADLVRENHRHELDLMRDALSYGVVDWAVTDRDIADVLRILESWSFHTQVEMVAALGDPFRGRLADNVSPIHFSRYRLSILAAYDALPGRHADALQDDPFKGMDWTGLTPQEHAALQRVIESFRETGKGQSWYANLDPKTLALVTDIRSRDPLIPEADARKEAYNQEQARQQKRIEAKEAIRDELSAGALFLDKARKRLTYSASDWAVTDAESVSLLDDIAMFIDHPAELRGIVDALDADGLLDRWVDNIPTTVLYTDGGYSADGQPINRRSVYLRVLMMRPPWRNSRKAEELLSRGLLDWAVTDNDAILAAQLVKALPDQVRAGLYTYDDGRFAGALENERSLSVRKGMAANVYTGGSDGGDLRLIKAQLLDDTTWHLTGADSNPEGRIRRLRQLILMARAADEARWVFDQSRDRYRTDPVVSTQYRDMTFFQRVIDPFGLFVPASFSTADGVSYPARETYEPEKLQGHAFGTDNALYQTVLRGLVLLGGSLFRKGSRLQIFRESIGGEGLNFADLAAMTGGSLMGAEFVDVDKTKGAQRAALLDNSVRWDLDHGIIEMRAARLDLSTVNYSMANLKAQTAGVLAEGLHLHMEYPDKQSASNVTVLRLRLDNLEINDFMLIRSGSILGIERIAVTGLYVDLQPTRNENPLIAPDESIAAGTILLTPLFNIAKIGGTIDALAKGLLEPTAPLNMTISAAGLQLSGVTTSGGSYINDIALESFTLRTRNPAGRQQYRQWLESERVRLEQAASRARDEERNQPARPERHWIQLDTEASLLRRKTSVDKELQTLDNAEATLAALSAKEATETLSEADQRQRGRLQAYLADIEKGGLALDIGQASASGFAGSVTMGDVTLQDVRAYGHSAGAVLGLLTESTTLNRMLRGPDYRGTLAGVETEGEPMAYATLGQIELDAVAIKGSIPSQEQADRDLRDATDAFRRTPYDPRRLEDLKRHRTRVAMTRDYWRVITQPEVTAADRDAFNTARTWLLDYDTMHVGHFVAKDTTLEVVHGNTGFTSIGLEARELEARDIDAKGVHLNTVNGTAVRLGVSGAGGLANVLSVGRPGGPGTVGAYVGAEQLRLGGLTHKASGAEIQSLLIDAAESTVDVKNGRTALGIAARKIEAMGVNWALSAQVLEYQRGKLARIPVAQRTKAEQAQLADIESLLDLLKVTTDQLQEVEAKLADKDLGAGDREQYTQHKAELDETLRFWQRKVELRKLTISDLNIDVSGLGDVLAADYSFADALKTGITVTGAGPDGQISSGVTAEGAWMRLDTGTTKELPKGRGTRIVGGGHSSVEQLSTGPIRGSITYAEDHISLNDFRIDELTLTDFRYYSGTTGIWGHGTTRLRDISITARIDTPLIERTTADARPEGADRRMSALQITSFGIAEVVADDIDYRNLASGFRLTLQSGSLLGIHAEGVDVDFGKSDADAMLIRGGTAGFTGAQGLHASASTASGLALSSVLNTRSLTARFATDGRITADLAGISATTHLSKAEFEANINAKSLTLRVELLPGAKGYKDAAQKFRLRGGTVGVEGADGPVPKAGEPDTRTTFGASMSGFDTGEITVSPTGVITAPAIHLPQINLDHLRVEVAGTLIEVEAGNTVQLLDTTASITAIPNPVAEDKRKATDQAFDRIVLDAFRIGSVVMTGIRITVRGEDGDILITLPSSRTSTLTDLTLNANPGTSEGFTIKPNENWAMLGSVDIFSMDLKGVGADLGDAVIETLDAEVTGFKIGFLGVGDTTVEFDALTATNIRGSMVADVAPGEPSAGAASHGSLLPKLRTAGFDVSFRNPGAEHRITARGFRMDKEGMSLKALEVAGLVYSDATKGIDIAIHKATLPASDDGTPAFTRTADGKITIPRIVVNDADFRIDDILKAGGPEQAAATDGKALTYGPDLALLDQLNGTIRFTMELFLNGNIARVGAYVAGPYNIVVRIVNGQIDFERMEDESTGYLADAALGFDYVRPGTLDLDHDPPRIRPPQLQLNITGADPIWWDLKDAEATLAETGWVRLVALVRQPPGMKASDEPTETALVSNLFFGNVDIHLELPGKSEIKLGNAGSIVLGGGGPNDSGFAIDVVSGELPAIKTTVSSLHANVASMNLKLASGALKTGAISITGSNVAELSFERQGVGPVYTDDEGRRTQNNLPVPKTLSGKLVNATLDDLEYTPVPAATRTAPKVDRKK